MKNEYKIAFIIFILFSILGNQIIKSGISNSDEERYSEQSLLEENEQMYQYMKEQLEPYFGDDT